MTIHVTPIPSILELATPAFTLGLTNTAGVAVTAVSSNSGLLAFDATVPGSISYGQSAGTGAATVASRRDHEHGMAASDAVAVASQAEVIAETSTAAYVPPDLMRDSPGVAKAYGRVAADGTLQSGSYNVESTASGSAGNYIWTWLTDFANTVYVGSTFYMTSTQSPWEMSTDTRAVGTLATTSYSGTTLTGRENGIVVFGEQ